MARHHALISRQSNMEDGTEVVITPISPLTGISEPIRRRRSSGSADFTMSRRPPSSRLRQVSIGPQLDRWDAMKTRLGVDSHAQLAEVLLDGMEAIVDGDVVWGTQCSNPTLKNKLASFFKRKGIPALVIPRPTRSASVSKLSTGRKKSPMKLKITLKKVVKGRKGHDQNGHEDEEADEDEDEASDDDDGDVGMQDIARDSDYSPHEPSRHGLKKAWLGRHLKGKHKTRQQRKRQVPKTYNEEDYDIDDADDDEEDVEDVAAEEEAEPEEAKKAGNIETPAKRKMRHKARKKLLIKKLRQEKKEKAKASTKTIEELFGPDAVLKKVYCCRKCSSQLDSPDVMKIHWQTHLAEDDGSNEGSGGKEEDATSRSKDGDSQEMERGGEEVEDEGDGDQEVPADLKNIARVMTRCPLCQKLFSNILAHTACHSNYLCEECGMLFRQRRSLKLHHRAVHELGETGQLPFVCTRCGRAFRWEASLRKHRTLHSQHRQYICQTCGKSFKVQAHLKRHVIMHEEVKPFVCPHCGRRFTELSNMKVHTRVHTGEKPYICDVCKKAYSHKVSLKTHKKKEHGIDMWQLGYITQPVIEFDDEGKETEYSIARRSRRPSANASGKTKKKKKEPSASAEDVTKADQVAQFVREANQEKQLDLNNRVEREDSETSQASQTSQTPTTAPAQVPPQHFIESKMQIPLQHAAYQQQQQQQQHQPVPIQPQIQQQPPPEVHPVQHIHPQHLQISIQHNRPYPHPHPHSHPAESSQQHMDDDVDSDPCSPEEEEENPRMLQAELITNQLRHAQRLQLPENNNLPSQPLPLQLPHSQALQLGPQQQQQQQLPSHTQTQPLPHIQIPGMRQLPPQPHQSNQRPPLPSFETVTSPDRQGHPQYRQGMMNTMPGLDLNALVASSMPYMYWGSQQYQGAPAYIQRSSEENSMESPKQ
ncbi:uncharacterized protein LOC119741860 [Patiria miniata]|uniref:C2H2-type domain-containing protein n=1 Tax=Patiria miniata TaxID=46514 RepID=A0A914BCD7_PATMI|nr:uncharacterized protein LOC119741860 [Patiria miniata]